MSLIYQFEEKTSIALEEKKERENRFFRIEDKGELLSIKTPAVNLIRKEDKLYVEKTGYLVEKDKLNYFFEILSQLRAQKFLDRKNLEKHINESAFFSPTAPRMLFTFKEDVVEFTLGEKLQTAKSFYVKINEGNKEKWAIAHDISPNVGLYTKEEVDNGAFHYTRVKSLFYLDEKFFHDTRVFKNDIVVQNALIDKTYSLDLIKQTTLPSPVDLEIKKDSIRDYIKGLLKLRAQELVYPYYPDKLTKPMSSISLNDGTVLLTLYHFYEGQEGHYLTINSDPALFILAPSAVPFFFTSIQDFWVKKVAKQKIEKFKLVFNDKKELDLEIRQGKIESGEGEKIKRNEVLKLIQALNSEADFLTEKQVKGKGFDIQLSNQKIKAIIKPDEVIFSEGNYNYHVRTDYQISSNLSDYLE